MIYIGIDPSVRANKLGLCVIYENIKLIDFVHIKNLDEYYYWFKAFRLVTKPDECQFFIEDSNLQRTIFASGDKAKNYRKIGVGVNRGACKNIISNIKTEGYNVYSISPLEKGTKQSDLIFKSVVKAFHPGYQIKGYLDPPARILPKNKAKWNEDKRDAYNIARVGLKLMKLHGNIKK